MSMLRNQALSSKRSTGFLLRHIGISSRVIGSSNDASDQLSNSSLPSGTGQGPFIELPHFKPLGHPSQLLNVALPQSSSLNIRNGSIIAVNGELSRITSESKLLSATTGYEEVYTEDAVSLLINGVTSQRNHDNENYSIINIRDNKEQWTILNDDSIIAWSGYNLKLKPAKLLTNFHSFSTEGKGVIVVNGKNQLFDVTLEEGETLLLNPNALIASTIPRFSTQILRRNTRIQELLPSQLRAIGHGIKQSIWKIRDFVPEPVKLSLQAQYARLRANLHARYVTLVDDWSSPPGLSQFKSSFYRFLGSVRLSLVALVARKPIFLRFVGPGKLVINNDRVVANDKVFSKQEIEDIFRNHS